MIAIPRGAVCALVVVSAVLAAELLKARDDDTAGG